jgi:hypothetical protein
MSCIASLAPEYVGLHRLGVAFRIAITNLLLEYKLTNNLVVGYIVCA